MVTVVANSTACAMSIAFKVGGRILSEAQEDVAMRCAEAVDGMYCGKESKNAGCWTNGRGQRAKTNYCAWQMGSMN